LTGRNASIFNSGNIDFRTVDPIGKSEATKANNLEPKYASLFDVNTQDPKSNKNRRNVKPLVVENDGHPQ
jgi:hypothetical protein